MISLAARKGARAARALLIGATIVALLALGLTALAQQPPANTHLFWGTVTSNGIPVPEGILVEAKVAGVTVQSTTVDSEGRYGYNPLFNVFYQAGQVVNGTPISFVVKGETADLYDVKADAWLETYPFAIGGATALDLEAVISFTITAEAGFGGAIEPEGEVVVTYMDDQEFTITPMADFAIKDVQLDGESVLADVDIDPDTGVGTYTVEGVAADHDLMVTFRYTKLIFPLAMQAY